MNKSVWWINKCKCDVNVHVINKAFEKSLFPVLSNLACLWNTKIYTSLVVWNNHMPTNTKAKGRKVDVISTQTVQMKHVILKWMTESVSQLQIAIGGVLLFQGCCVSLGNLRIFPTMFCVLSMVVFFKAFYKVYAYNSNSLIVGSSGLTSFF